MKNPLVTTLAVLLFAESAVMASATLYLVVEIFTAAADSLLSAVGLTLLAAVATIWLVFIAVNTLRGRAWVRGAALTWQLFQVVIGVGCLQGLFATPTVGWLLIAAAVVVVVLLFTPPVVAATRDREPSNQD